MLWQILITAVVSAITTLFLAACVYYLLLRPTLEKRLSVLAAEMETRVRTGVESAGEQMLPAFRVQVREGFLEAMEQWPSSEFRNVTRAGADIVEEGLSTLFGRRKKD